MNKNVALAIPAVTEMSEYRSKIATVRESADSLVIKKPKDLETAETLLKLVHDGERSITDRKKEITAPLMASLASVRELFKPLEQGFTDAKSTLKRKMLAYSQEIEAKEEKKREQILARVEKGTMKGETAVAKIEEMSAAPKANTRTVKKLSIVDVDAIPRDYMVPDREAITRALFAGLVVPGALLIEEKIIAVR